MIGNDIIDLALAQKESNCKRNGFLDKIFTKNEQLLILNSEDPEFMIWNLWSRKEATYKIYNRQTEIRGFFPLKMECIDLEINNEFTFGKVFINDCIYFTKTKVTTQYIYTIAVERMSDFEKIIVLNNRNNIQKNNGIPSYLEKVNNILKPVSISHHGRYEKLISI